VTGASYCGAHCPQAKNDHLLTRAADIHEIVEQGFRLLPEADFIVVDVPKHHDGGVAHLMFARNLGIVGLWDVGDEEAALLESILLWEVTDGGSGPSHDARRRIYTIPGSREEIGEWWDMFGDISNHEIIHRDPDFVNVYSFYTGPYNGDPEEWEPHYEDLSENHPYLAQIARSVCGYGCCSLLLDHMDLLYECQNWNGQDACPILDSELVNAADSSILDIKWGAFHDFAMKAWWNLELLGCGRIKYDFPADEMDLFYHACAEGFLNLDRHPESDKETSRETNWIFTRPERFKHHQFDILGSQIDWEKGEPLNDMLVTH
jgi:hypothetical protein